MPRIIFDWFLLIIAFYVVLGSIDNGTGLKGITPRESTRNLDIGRIQYERNGTGLAEWK